MTESTVDSNAPGSQADAVDSQQVQAAFREAWERGERPSLQHYLSGVPADARDHLLTVLLPIEWQQRLRSGEQPTPEEYETLFAEHAAIVKQLSAALIQPDGLSIAETIAWNSDVTPDEQTTILPESLTEAYSRLGRYRLVRQLGRGGFGEVWQGYDPELSRNVAIKFPRTDRAWSRDAADHFISEARKLARLDFPGVVPVYDVGRFEDRMYVVSKLIPDGTLGDRIRRERIPQDEAVELVATVAEALHRCHTKDITHRDIKPANILIDEQGRPFLTDFGLAVSEAEQLQECAAVLGTIMYMSPEQARGENRHVDARTDIYSLGVVLYRLLTGRLPFSSKKLPEYLEQVEHGQPRPLRAIDETVPVELETICLKCLARSVEDRYRTAKDLATELRQWQCEQAAEPEPKPRLWMLASVFSVLLLAVGVSLWAFLSAPGTRDVPDPTVVVPHEDSIEELFARWSERLDEKPSEIIWPGKSGPTKPIYDEKRDAVQLICNESTLFRLGELSEDQDVTLGVKLLQLDWNFNVGLFFGYREELQDGTYAASCQVIWITPNVDEDDQYKPRMRRGIATFPPHKKWISIHPELGYEDIPYPQFDTWKSLQCRIRGKSLVEATWNGIPLKGFANAAADSRMPEGYFEGPWGVVVKSGTVWVKDPFIVTQQETDNHEQ